MNADNPVNVMKYVITLVLIIFMVTPALMADEPFVNWRAGYYVMHPDNWYHVPYRTVNIFLTSQEVRVDEFDYDAVLAMEADKPFFEVPYIFLSHAPTGKPTQAQIDSVLTKISRDYGRKVVHSTLRQDRNFNLNQPIYDEEIQAVAVKSRVTSEHADKMLLDITRFHDSGVVFMICYSPKEMYKEARPVFLDIMNSFSTDDLEKVAPRDSFQVVDLSERELEEYDESQFPDPEDKPAGINVQRYIFGFLLLIIIFGLLRLFVFKKKKQD